jgi:RepB plasmid partitioning protein/ParB-like nuclease domain
MDAVTTTPPKSAFDPTPIVLPLEKILPVRQFKDGEKNLGRFRTIVASIRVVGLLEPLMVHAQKGGAYTLADGHVRYHALKELGHTEALCLLADDDESFTYNHHVNHLAPIQAHRMISRAVKNGVSPERIAEALNVKVEVIISRMNLLVGIHPDVVDLLKDKQLSDSIFHILRKVKPLRQIEMAELMSSANNFTKGYAEALLKGTIPDDLVNPNEPKKARGMTPEEIARMEQEMATISSEFKAIESSYGETVLNLTLAKNYVAKLLANAKVSRFLAARHNDYFAEFQRIAATDRL